MINSGKLLISSKTCYTALAGVHSEVSQGACARASVYDRRSSETVSTEQLIHMKELQSLNSSKRLIQKSMLAYSQKMKDISNKRELGQLKLKATTRRLVSPPPLIKDRAFEETPKPEIPVTAPYDLQINTTRSIEDLNMARASVDSGIESDIVSDGYLSDTDCPIKSSQSHIEVSLPGPSLPRKSSAGSISSSRSDSMLNESRALARRRERRRRLGVGDKLELPTVFDTENDEQDENKGNCIEISSFPEYLRPDNDHTRQQNNLASTDVTTSKVTNALQNPTYWSYRVTKSPRPNEKSQGTVTKPKAISSPSVASIRSRNIVRRKKPGKKVTKSFRYSDHMGDLLVSSSSSVSSVSDGSYDSVVEAVNADLESIREELKLRLNDFEEEDEIDSANEDTDKIDVTYYSSLDNIHEHDASNLKSALKSSGKLAQKNPRKKRNVHFFLPDIYEKNASQ